MFFFKLAQLSCAERLAHMAPSRVIPSLRAALHDIQLTLGAPPFACCSPYRRWRPGGVAAAEGARNDVVSAAPGVQRERMRALVSSACRAATSPFLGVGGHGESV